MPSPFPGMDPYIEQSKLWVDFHNGLADEIRAQLNSLIRPDYFARLTPYTTYEVIGINQVKRQSIRPDVGVLLREQAVRTMPRPIVIEKAPVESLVENEAQVDLLSVEIYQTNDEVLVSHRAHRPLPPLDLNREARRGQGRGAARAIREVSP